VIVPALKARDFNLASVSDAVIAHRDGRRQHFARR
jgi:hypothetical protein